jgi:hypothetical protein
MTDPKFASPPPRLPDLREIGSRYSHYAELRDVFADGVEVVKSALKYHESASDRERLVSLQHAVKEIEGRLATLSNFDDIAVSWGRLGREIDGIQVMSKKQLTEGIDAAQPRNEKSLPPCPKRHPNDNQEPPAYT